MAGAPSKAFGGIFTVIGAVALVSGLVLAVYGANGLEEETAKTFMNEGRANGMAQLFISGVITAGLAFAVLLISLPWLIWGLHRERNPETRATYTRPGGALRAWGITFLVLGVLAILVGMVAAAYGGSVADGESQRFFASRDRADAAVQLAGSGLVVAGGGLIFAILAIPLLVGAGVRASKAQPRAVVALGAKERAAAVATPTHPVVFGLAIVAGAALIVAILMVAIVNPGQVTAAGVQNDPTTVQFEGQLTGGSAPNFGSLGTGRERAVHTVTPATASGLVEALVSFDDSVGTASLVVTIEAQDAQGEWHPVTAASGSDADGTAATTDPMTFAGDVRIVITFAEGSAGDVRYQAIVNIVPR